MNVLVFDTETTGLFPKKANIENDDLSKFPYIVQFSYIIYDISNCNQLAICDYIVKLPENVKMEQECISIHGITNEISQLKGLSIQNVIYKFVEDCKTFNVELIIAHNLEFDMNMLKLESKRNNIDIRNVLHSNKYCTMQSSIELCNLEQTNRFGKYKKYPKLSELYNKLFGSIPNNLHNALNDVIVCLNCYYKLVLNIELIERDDKMKLLMNKVL
jgi:DNA polymerase III epsilon subunit-like protein